ncbi:hypothetical protein Pst134EA_009539 [Puccinia striiformis f. sp. tritici]|uniref:hypothetical protein n=1 Tax=Puccinia striiformis f. sp. tritici TaxID=168172 RepID=UPI0020082A6B|nr:hypothetical protein Pst134EA_009539 [Puccinia striiformis f. sp. tritici]KAH9469018.1 hypothetical protein Pst134EA_009539 [Puccinia striiformis f. sp. tritici]KAI9621419.1 hypothetical protein H4Q26_015719 [Puccinia striiformis f. sp. tritici PST-130]KAI9630247.1 hypothetical protein KEM48_014173 [Puccinia striiformis f. sp. tritici PST-130]
MQVNICAFLGFMLALVGLRAAEELFFCDLILGDRPRGLCVDQIIKTGKKAKHYPRRNSLFFKCDKGFDSYCCSKVTDSNVHRGIPLSPYDLEVKCGQQCLPPPQ